MEHFSDDIWKMKVQDPSLNQAGIEFTWRQVFYVRHLLCVAIGQEVWGISGKHNSHGYVGHFVSTQKSYTVPEERLIET